MGGQIVVFKNSSKYGTLPQLELLGGWSISSFLRMILKNDTLLGDKECNLHSNEPTLYQTIFLP